MSEFLKKDYTIDGIRIQVLEAGEGRPLVYFHGAGATGGFEELLPLAWTRRLILPIHPGFGASDDDPRIDSVLDYVLHYSALFDHLQLHEPVDLIGHSLGGWIASLYAIFNQPRIRRLALVAPAGLRVPEYPTTDLFTIPQDKIASYLFAVPPSLPTATQDVPASELIIARYREMTTLARFIWERNYEPKFDRWLTRISVPVLLLWGVQDRIIPVEQAKCWADRLGGSAEIARFDGAGHLLLIEKQQESIGRLSFFFE